MTWLECQQKKSQMDFQLQMLSENHRIQIMQLYLSQYYDLMSINYQYLTMSEILLCEELVNNCDIDNIIIAIEIIKSKNNEKERI